MGKTEVFEFVFSDDMAANFIIYNSKELSVLSNSLEMLVSCAVYGMRSIRP